MDIFLPLENFSNWLTFGVLEMGESSRIAQSINFFIYDTAKILILLVIVNYLMAIFRHYLPTTKLRNILKSRKWYGLDYLIAALFGVFTPFCSCSSIPIFIGFVGAGIPLGVTTAFLITSPLVNEASLALFPALFGWEITLIYNILGIVIGVVGGFIISKLQMERFIESELLNFGKNIEQLSFESEKIKVTSLLKVWWGESWQITRSLAAYVVIGVGVGALIHGYLPSNFFEDYLVSDSWWTVPLSTLIGVPLYANSLSVIPIVGVLIEKGITLGTALAFMTATVTLSIPEALILRKVMKLPLLLTFFGITTIGIISMGYLFNLIY